MIFVVLVPYQKQFYYSVGHVGIFLKLEGDNLIYLDPALVIMVYLK
jgi:hypothetical protein